MKKTSPVIDQFDAGRATNPTLRLRAVSSRSEGTPKALVTSLPLANVPTSKGVRSPVASLKTNCVLVLLK